MFTSFFFFNDTATTEIYTLSLHDALPICLLEAGVDALPHPGQGLAFAAQRQAAVGLLQAAELLHRAPEAVNALLLERADGDDPGLPQALVVVGVLGIAVHAQQAQAGGDLGLRARGGMGIDVGLG